jgi:biopolymer transport protein ExbD
MRKGRSLQLGIGENEVNLSPLIDMIFILLIFFIVASVFVEEPFKKINRVKTIIQEPLISSSMILAISAENEVIYGQDLISSENLQSLFERVVKKNKRPLLIQVDESSNTDVLIQILKQAKLSGVKAQIATTN